MAADISNLSGAVRAAYIALVATKVAPGLGMDANTVQLFEQQYRDKLQKARIADLEVSATGDQVTKEVIATLRAPFAVDDPKLPITMTIIYEKVSAVKYAAFSEVKAAYEWTWSVEADMDGLARAAYIALCCQKLAVPCGLDAQTVQSFEQIYQAKLTRAIVTAIEADIALGENSTGNMKRCCDEVRATLETPAGEALDKLALGAAAALCFTKCAARAGYDASFLQLKEQEYAQKIQECRKLKLNRALKTNTDPVLTELLANFRSDDAGLANAYEIYTQRASSVKQSAYAELEHSHNWRWIDSAWTSETAVDTKIAAMDGLSKSAFTALTTKLLAISCGLAPEMIQVYEKLYQTRLRSARVADLETTPITDPVQREVMAHLRATFSGDAALPRDLKTLTDKIDDLKDMARKDVLAAHDWSFAEMDMACDSDATEHPDEVFQYHVTLPKDCLLVSACYGTDGKVGQWKLRGREIHARSRIVRVVYVRDTPNYASWHPKAYRAFILRLVADVAKCVAADPKERTLQEQLYRDALEEAKTCDARSANAPDEAWGENDIAETMLHGYDRDDPLCRD